MASVCGLVNSAYTNDEFLCHYPIQNEQHKILTTKRFSWLFRASFHLPGFRTNVVMTPAPDTVTSLGSVDGTKMTWLFCSSSEVDSGVKVTSAFTTFGLRLTYRKMTRYKLDFSISKSSTTVSCIRGVDRY